VRIIEYQVSKQKENAYILMTTLLDEKTFPARELAKLYPQRWEVELMFDEMKTHLKDGKTLLRSQSPEMILQELYGLLLAYRAVRTMMNAAAQRAQIDSDRLSFTESFNIIRRKLVAMPALSPSGNI
jgi:IS4 transposase